MYLVYAIKSSRDGRMEVRMVVNDRKRLIEHNSGKTKYTKGYKPWQLIYTESLPSRLEAGRREKYLKSGVGKEFLKTLGPVVQWIEYLPAGRQGSFLNF